MDGVRLSRCRAPMFFKAESSRWPAECSLVPRACRMCEPGSAVLWGAESIPCMEAARRLVHLDGHLGPRREPGCALVQR